MLIFDEQSPYRYLELRGDAEVTPDPDYTFADKVGAKYGGADLRERDNPGDTRVVITIHPTRVVGSGRPPNQVARPSPGPALVARGLEVLR